MRKKYDYQKSQQITYVGEDVEKREHLCTVGGIATIEKTVWRFLKKLKTEVQYDPEIPLLGIYPKKWEH